MLDNFRMSNYGKRLTRLVSTLVQPSEKSWHHYLDLTWNGQAGASVTFDWANNSSKDLVIAKIIIDWPPANDSLFNVFNGGNIIWNGEDTSPPTTITSFIGTVAARTWAANTNDDIAFFFGLGQPTGYDLTVIFNNGWSAHVSH